MHWEKKGHIFAPQGESWWCKENASFPTVEVISEDTLRVYYTSLDENKVGRVGFIDVDSSNPTVIKDIAKQPVLEIGAPGTFDDSGVNAFSVVSHRNKRYLYYQGWQRTVTVPYMIFSGVAIAEGGNNNFVKYSSTPILDRTEDDLFIRGAPFVLIHGEIFHMWYSSCSQWIFEPEGPRYRVGIRYASSPDGIRWSARKQFCVEPDYDDEYAVGRPSVLYDGMTFRMWYSVRSRTRLYHLGYAESSDGTTWERKDDQIHLENSMEGWDSEMICYPQVVIVKERALLFYNGNRHGASGFGFAETAWPER